MSVTVRLPTQLREYAAGQAHVDVDGTTVGEDLAHSTGDAVADGAEVTIMPAVSGG